jgi:rubrerythrin
MTVARGLAIAMQTELEGFEFYKIAAARCKDNGAKRMFESLAKDEVEHHKILRERYYAIVEGKDFKAPKIPARSRLRVKSPVFSKRFLDSKKHKHFEMSALTVGILLEQNAIAFFSGEAKKTSDREIKKLFRELAIWEGEHLRALMAQKQFLQRAIFADARFEPM